MEKVYEEENIKADCKKTEHKYSTWQSLSRGFFVSGIIKFGHSINMIYCIDAIYGRVLYKNPSLQGDIYICEIPSPFGIYITTSVIDHHANKPLSLEDMTTFHICKHYHLSKRMKWSFHLNQNTFQFVHTTCLQTCHLIVSLGLAKIVSSYRSTTYQIKLM